MRNVCFLILLFVATTTLAADEPVQLSVSSAVPASDLSALVKSRLAPEFHAVRELDATFVGFQINKGNSVCVLSADREKATAAMKSLQKKWKQFNAAPQNETRPFYQINQVAQTAGAKGIAVNIDSPNMIMTYDKGKQPTVADIKKAGFEVAERKGKKLITDLGAQGGSIVVRPINGKINQQTIKNALTLSVAYIQPQYPAVRIPEPKADQVAMGAGGGIGSIPELNTFQPTSRKINLNQARPAASEKRPTDQYYDRLWGMEDLNAPTAWATKTDASPIIVAVVDTGVDYNHVDLAPNMWKNNGEIPNDRIDNDGNGYVDDVYGYDFIANDSNPIDDHSHGSHCSGTIGALGNGPQGSNGNRGVAGVCWKVRIMAIRILGAQRGSYDPAEHVKYAVDNGAKVLSNSWTSFTSYSDSLKRAIDYARDNNVIYVAAAANENKNNDARPHYPSSYPNANVIAVGAMTQTQQRASFSNWGKTSVDLFAPGTNIWSTTPNNMLQSMSGTSMACPHVAGATALVWSQVGKDKPWQQVKEFLMTNSRKVPALQNLCVTGGTLDLKKFATIEIDDDADNDNDNNEGNAQKIREIRTLTAEIRARIQAIEQKLNELENQ